MLSALLAAALWIGPAYSGSWYSPARNGEGFTLQVLDNGTAHALWFTYPPAGSTAQQAWIYASGGAIDGDTIRFTSAYTTRGPRFGPQFDPAAVQLIPWGTIEFRFTDCNNGRVSYAGPTGWGSGAYDVTRLTALSELECAGKRRLSPSGTRLLDGMRARSGGWFDPAHNGEGWQVEELPDGRTQVYWFTYDERGEQAWTIGVAPTSGTRMTVAQNLRPVGARFGSAFDPSHVRLENWGRLELQLDGCTLGNASYQSALPAFGSGTLRATRLTVPAGAVCIDGTPSRPSTLTWSTAPSMARAQSEAAAAVLGTHHYVAGGLPDTRTFQRFDTAANAWTLLPELPDGRDHTLAVGMEGSVYLTGGTGGLRYVVAENRWESFPQLPPARSSGAATLGGYGWFGNLDGTLTQFNPRTGATRVIAGDNRAPRDHSSLVAFGGELWMIGGRGNGETGRVSIFDPGSETWRAGPTMRVARAGAAAAATETMLVVAGGEVIRNGTRTAGEIEAIAAGESSWNDLSALPTPVHGASASIHGNSLYVFGGSTLAGGVQNPGTVQVGAFTTTRIAFASSSKTAVANSNAEVTIVRTGGGNEVHEVFYEVEGEGCASSFVGGPVRFGPGVTSTTISVPLRTREVCRVWLRSSPLIGNPNMMAITIVPFVPGCPAPSDDVVLGQLAGPGNLLIQRQRSGQTLLLDLPTIAQGNSGQITFSENLGAASPQPVTIEISISRCPAVIDTDTSSFCNLRSTQGHNNSITWLFRPSGPIVDAATANQRGACWAGDTGPYYVNARWTFPACPFNVETCGFAIQYNQGGF